MSGYSDRALGRAWGTSGRIQPKLAPLTGSEPWAAEAPPPIVEVSEALVHEHAPVEPFMREHAPVEPVELQPRRTGSDRPAAPSQPRVVQEAPQPRVEPRRFEHPPQRPLLGVRGEQAEPPRAEAPGAERPRPSSPSPEHAPAIGERPLAGPPTAATDRHATLGLEPLVAVVGPSRSHDAARGRTSGSDVHPSTDRATPQVDAAPVTIERSPSKAWRVVEPSRGDRVTPSRRMSDAEAITTAAEPRPSWLTSEPPLEAAPRWKAPGGPEHHAAAPLRPSASPTVETPSRGPERRSAAEASEPVVRIDIGRVDVRAAPPPERSRARPSRIAKPATFVSLAQYLHERGRS